MKDSFILFVFIILVVGCQTQNDQSQIDESKKIVVVADTFQTASPIETELLDTCHWYDYLDGLGLVDVQQIDSTVLVDLKYASEDNFMKKDVYGCLNKCYLQPDVAQRIKDSQSYLKSIDSTLSLKIYDGLRPRSVQQIMWDILDMPITEKTKFVSNPKNGSLHNFGAAVDITLVKEATGEELDMGTPYDYIGINAWPSKEPKLLADSVLTQQQVDNRKLLRKVMKHSSFINIQTEWWHFNACSRTKAYEIYSIVE
jgi:D-alanyl-D-alanine dipeptidase